MAMHEIPVDGTDHDRTVTCPCQPSRRDRAGGGITYVHNDRRPEETGREATCGHVIIEASGEQQHHQIPDDGAPHAPTTECGCSPQRVTTGDHVVYQHADPDGDSDADLWTETYGGDQ